MEQLRISNNLIEIAQLLKMLVGENHKVMLWQHNSEKDERNICYAELKKIDFQKMELVLAPLSGMIKSLHDTLTLYIHSNFKSMLFKIENAKFPSKKTEGKREIL